MSRLLCVAALALVAAGCAKKPKKVVAEADAAPAATRPATTEKPVPPGFQPGANTNFVPGGGAVQNIRQAARRTVAINDMHQLGVFIQQKQVEDGAMPGKDDILAYIGRDAPKIAAAVKDGDIILTGTKSAQGLWAYEVEADTKGGIVLVGGAASRATAAEVKKLLGQ